MTEFVNSIKADLLDRRLLPLVVLVVVGLLGAVAYVVVGGGSSATTPPRPVATGAGVSSGVAVTQASTEDAVAETTAGSGKQHHGSARNPFAPLPEAKSKKAAVKSSGSSSSSSSGSGSGSSSSSRGSSQTTSTPQQETTKPSQPAKPKTVYHVAVLFGLLPAAGPLSAQLTPYENLKLLTPLPSAKQPLIIFRGVTAGGKSATFTLASEAILHGGAACLPNASQCEAIDLKSGQTEQLEYVTASGQSEIYELRVVSIVAAKASSSTFKGVLRAASKPGRELLRKEGLMALPGLRFSPQTGVLVFAGHRAFGAHGHAAAAHHRSR